MEAPYISVIGGDSANTHECEVATEVGRLLAERGYRLVCGGRGGVMEAAAAGHRQAGGSPIGLLPSRDRSEANEYISIAIVTGLGNMRNALVVENGDAIIAIGGSYGTLSEIALALDAGRTVFGLETHEIEGIQAVSSPREAVDSVEDVIGSG